MRGRSRPLPRDEPPASPYLSVMSTTALDPAILETAGVNPDEARAILSSALQGADDGELFLERSESESLVFDD
jgi:TldD protein